MCQQWQRTEPLVLKHAALTGPQVRQCPVPPGNAVCCCFWCTGFTGRNTRKRVPAVRAVQHIQHGCEEVVHPSTSRLAHLAANMRKCRISVLVTALLCFLHNRETLSSTGYHLVVLPALVRGLEAGGRGEARSSLCILQY